MKRECPICGRPLSNLDVILGETSVTHQCTHCWSRVNATGPVGPEVHAVRRPPLLAARKRKMQRRHV